MHKTITDNIGRGSHNTYIYIEALRILACFLVIFNHTGNFGFSRFTTMDPGSSSFWLLLIPSIFCKAAVFIFFAITGALLLGKEEPISVIWKKRIPRTLAVLILFSFFYYCINGENTIQSFNIWHFFRSIFQKNITSAYWYLYAHLALLICLPFLRILVKNLQDKHFYYMFALCFFFNGVLPVFSYFTGIRLSSNFSINWLLDNIVFYPCLGYFLHSRFDVNKCKKALLPLWILNILTIAISCYCTYYYGVNTAAGFSQQSSQVFHITFVMVNCTTLFITYKYLFTRFTPPVWLASLIKIFGSCTFGTYLLHGWLLHYCPPFKTFWWDFSWNFNIPIFPGTLIICCITLLICTAITLILKQIPILKKLI